MENPDYQTLYLRMFNKLSDGIEQLQQIQQESEELYIQQTGRDSAIIALDFVSNAQHPPPESIAPGGKTAGHNRKY